jgi:hypothetical protein
MGTWFRTPQPLRAAVIAAAWFSYGLLISDLNSLQQGTRSTEIIWGACLAGAAITMAADAGVHRRFSSAEELLTYNRALKTGDLPEGIDVRQWRRRLRRSRLVIALAGVLVYPIVSIGCMSGASSHAAYHALPQWGFALVGVVSFAGACRRGTRIGGLESALKRRQPRRRSGSVKLNEQERWHLFAETSLAARIAIAAAVGTLLAFAALLLGDLDSVVNGESRGSHVLWAAIWAAAVGFALSTFTVADPHFHATTRTVDEIMRYDRAFRTGELPEHLDVEVWRGWMKGHRKSTGALLLWACFLWLVGCRSILTHLSGYHWAVALLLELLAIRQFLCWRSQRAGIARLVAQVDRHARMQPFSNHPAPLGGPVTGEAVNRARKSSETAVRASPPANTETS